MFKYMKKYWWIGLLGSAFMVGEVLIDLVQPRLMERIVDEGILGIGHGGIPNIDLVISVGIRMILIVICGGLCGILSGVFVNISAQRFGNDVRKACFRRIMNFSFEQTDNFTTGSLITRTTSDVTQVQNMVAQLIRGGVRCAMFFVAGSAALMTMDLAFGQVLMIALPVVLCEILFVVWKTGPLFGLLQRRLDRMNSVIGENIAGARVVKAFVQEKREEEKFAKSNQDLVDTQFRVMILFTWMRPIMNIVLNLATVAVIQIGALRVQEGAIAPGAVMAAITYLAQILNGMMMLAMIFQNITRGVASSKRLKEVLRTEPAVQDGPGVSGAEGERGHIRLSHVHFSYPGFGEEVLHDINLEILPGETLAVIGATGSGKSTLVDMIARFYDTTRGDVEIDGENVKRFTLAQLHDRIAFVLQKSELFSTTIKENILLGREGATDEEVKQAAADAQADDFISAQPQGYDTPVAEAGMSLSGGQRQRIAISRALLRKAEILILDDSTSALDLRTEAALFAALRKNYADCTKVIIAQRIATVMRADRIAVLDHGRIVGCGTHERLMESCEVYRDIYDSQLRKGEKSA